MPEDKTTRSTRIQAILMQFADTVGIMAEMAELTEQPYKAYRQRVPLQTDDEILDKIDACIEDGLKRLREERAKHKALAIS